MYADAQTPGVRLNTYRTATREYARSERGEVDMAEVKRLWSLPQIIWSALIAIVVWSAVGFSWFGYGFDWTTQVGASRMSTEVLVDNLASICVAQARSSSDADAWLAKLAALQNWKQREFIEEAQWASNQGVDKCISIPGAAVISDRDTTKHPLNNGKRSSRESTIG